MSSAPLLTPQERLALSRQAIVRHMSRDSAPGHAKEDPALGTDGDARAVSPGNWKVIKRALRAWWQHHPASLAVGVVRPVVDQYAREHPLRLLGIAAGAGAAAVLLKPWRLVSLGGVLLATMKSSNLSGIVLSMLSASPQDSDNPKEAP